MKHYVYKVTNTKNNKWYIGKRKHHDPYNDKYMGSGKLIKEAIEKHGKQNFKKEILAIFESDDKAAALEAKLVTKESIATDMSYNMHEGGYGGFAHINDGSLEHRQRAQRGAAKSTGRQHPNWGKGTFIKGDERTKLASIKANQIKSFRGTSEETRLKMRLAAKRREEKRKAEGYYNKA